MELLYVVELDVVARAKAERPEVYVWEKVLEHVATWVSHDRSPQVPRSAFEASGSAVLASELEDRADTRTSWRTEGTVDAKALVLAVRTEISKSGRADFICNITVFREDGRTAVRIELARESLDGVLAPSGIDFFRRPSLIGLLLRDSDLECWAGPTRVDGRFNWVNQKHADYVWKALTHEGRLLPTLLVDGSVESGEQLARRAARELAGLAVVLAVDNPSQRALHDRLRSIDALVPPGGACLIWPDASLRHPAFTRDQAPFVVARLLRMLSSISVTVRGVNQLLRTAQNARRAETAVQVAADLAAARANGDLTQEVGAQARAIERLKDESSQYLAWLEEVEEERDRYKALAAQAVYWKQEADRARQTSGARSINWDEAPELDRTDLSPLAQFLMKESQGAIVFTPQAARSWKRDPYPHIDAMHDALITLTKAAIEYRRLGCQLGMFPDEWFKLEWEMNLAATDKYMSTNGLDSFDFDGRTYSRLPHLKMGDHTSPNEVGRVYFAMDPDGERFIVDHVGLKLYGL